MENLAQAVEANLVAGLYRRFGAETVCTMSHCYYGKMRQREGRVG